MPALAGELHYCHRLSGQDVSAIRKTYRPGEVTYVDLAEEYGVSRQLIHKIITRKVWRHLEHC